MTLGLYVHLPFCRVHCTYCAFAVSTDASLQDAYVEALLGEIDQRASGQPVETIYFGGGTPSRTSVPQLARIAACLRERFDTRSIREFTLEANPEDVTAEAVSAWAGLGVNRLSIGVQSFHDAELLPLGRIHGADRARLSLEIAVSSGIRTSLDLILGLPNQTESSFASSLEEAVASGVGHISVYMLDLEEKSALEAQVQQGRVTLPDEEVVATSYGMAIERLAAAGLQQYEISNFARSGEESLHNLRYWRRLEYLGFGVGAHSFSAERRFANTRQIDHYLSGSPDVSDFSESLGADEKRRETIFLGMRQRYGLDYSDIERLCGQEGIAWIERGMRDGWLRRNETRVAFTAQGFLLSNEYISQLF